MGLLLSYPFPLDRVCNSEIVLLSNSWIFLPFLLHVMNGASFLNLFKAVLNVVFLYKCGMHSV